MIPGLTRIWLVPAAVACLACSALVRGQSSSAPATQPYEDRLIAGRATWAFSAPREPAIPPVRNAGWCKSPVDRFILAGLEAKALKPAPAADKRTLIRRAYFDLIGLPPAPQEVEAFVNDNSPDAFAKVVDHLLASPRYGERWARHWLDVVRYTDSFDARGVASEGDVKFAWRYRDWVIKAFNEDLPYDQFINKQIAGDLLPQAKPGEFDPGNLVATGMYVLGNWPGGDADREKMMTDIVDDQIDVTSRAFLGLTVACARCHDHKFDPISQKDYYGLAGFFFSSHFLPSPGSKTSGSPLVVTPMASAEQLRQRAEHDQKLASLQKQIEQFTDEQYARLAQAQLPRAADYLAAAAEFDRHRAEPANGSLKTLAAAHNLDSAILASWVDYVGPSLHGAVLRKSLTKPMHTVAGKVGVDGWLPPDGRSDPCVICNSTDQPVSFSTLSLPAHSFAMHPGEQSGVAVGWTSPLSASMSIRGRVIDGDPNGGDGIDWRIERCRGNAVETLASGSFPNGGNQDFAQGEGGGKLQSVDVKPGDLLQLTVFPKATYICDTTIVELEIAETDGEKRAWSLLRDVVPDVLVGEKGNPHTDSQGHAGVWQFFETGPESRGGIVSPGSALARWLDAGDDLARASADLNAALMAVDAQARKLTEAGKDLSTLDGPDAKLYRDLMNTRGPFWAEARKQPDALPPEARVTLAGLSQQVSELKKNPPPPIEQANALIEGGVPESQYAGTHDCPIMVRGRYDRQGPVVPRAFPRLLAGDQQKPITQGSGRLELARWIASASNPMTAKVMVNRLWQHHFGDGIVRTPNNFGKLGIPPTHPELLDFLARRFVDSGWSIKAMHRMILLSAAYQQSSEPDAATYKADPGNLLWGHMNRQRLEAEPFRDALLSVTGSLDPAPGGPAYRDPNTPRRTIYLMTIRSDRSNYRTLFDAADPTAIVDKRIDSTVAPQALFLMNDPFVMDRAKALAARLIGQSPAEARDRITQVYLLLYSRPPSEREVQIGLSATQNDGSAAGVQEAWTRYCQVLLCANEFVYVD